MSYSFTAKGSNKAEVLADVAKRLADVVDSQPVHAKDIGIAQDSAAAIINAMQDDDTRDISVTVSGSIWVLDGGVQSCSLSISASFAVRAAV